MPSGEETRQPQRLAHRPRLERAAARRVRRVAVGDLRQMPEPRVVEMREQGVEEARARLGARRRRAAPDAHPGLDERAHEPRPDRALMVRAVALAWTARVARRVTGLAGRERAEAERGHEPRLDRVDDTAGAGPPPHPAPPAAAPGTLGGGAGGPAPPPPAVRGPPPPPRARRPTP